MTSKEDPNEATEDIATLLARRGADQLGMSLLGDSVLSKFLGTLLDTITKQRYQVIHLDSEAENLSQQLVRCRESHLRLERGLKAHNFEEVEDREYEMSTSIDFARA